MCQYPLPLHQVIRLVRCFKTLLFRSLSEDPSSLTEPVDAAAASVATADPISNQQAGSLAAERFCRFHALRVIADVLQNLYARWARKSFCFSDVWEVPDTASRQFKDEVERGTALAVVVESNMPWAMCFHQRMLHFRSVVDLERRGIQGSDTDPAYRSRGTQVRIRKSMVLEDGMNALDRFSAAALKDRIVVQYINEVRSAHAV
jgi:hypothetical protein